MHPSMLKDKVVIVTGASSGIGKALVEAGLAAGAKLVLAARNRDAMEEVARGADPAKYLIVPADVSQEVDCERIISETIERFGQIDILINNAGVSMRALFSETTPEVLENVMKVNFWGAVYCTHYALPWLLRSRGSLVGVSSIAGYKGLPARSGYAASKFALQGFLECLRIENLKKGLHVLIACPGFTRSNIRKTALSGDGTVQGESPREEEKMMSAEEVAKQILRAVVKRRRTLILTLQGRLAVWLNKWLPSLTDKLVYRHLAKETDSPFR